MDCTCPLATIAQGKGVKLAHGMSEESDSQLDDSSDVDAMELSVACAASPHIMCAGKCDFGLPFRKLV